MQCAWKRYYYPDNRHVTAIYYVDGVKYEYTTSRGLHGGAVSFYYNAEDPTDTVVGSWDALVIILPCVFRIGIFMITIGVVFYKKSKNKLNKNKRKKDSKVNVFNV